MTERELSSHVSGRIARSDPLEGGPAHEAMMKGNDTVSAPWGHYASKLLENNLDMTIDEVKQALGVSSEMLADPESQFGDQWPDQDHFSDSGTKNPTRFYNKRSYGKFKGEREAYFLKEIVDDLVPELKRLENIARDIRDFFVHDQEPESDTVMHGDDILEYDSNKKENIGDATKLDSLASNHRATLADFLGIALGCGVTGIEAYQKDDKEDHVDAGDRPEVDTYQRSNEEDPGDVEDRPKIDTSDPDWAQKAAESLLSAEFDVEPSELSHVWVGAIASAIDFHFYNKYGKVDVIKGESPYYSIEGINVKDIFVDDDFFEVFIDKIKSSFREYSNKLAKRMYEELLKPVFEVTPLDQHSLVTGENPK